MGSSSTQTAPKRLAPTRALASRKTSAKMTDFWIWREERAFKMATAKQCSAPRHAGIHLQERLALRRLQTDFTGHFPVLRGRRVSVIGHKRQASGPHFQAKVLAGCPDLRWMAQANDGVLIASCKGVNRTFHRPKALQHTLMYTSIAVTGITLYVDSIDI